MIEFGTALRQAREAAGISLDELFERTRISLKHLRSIEAGDFPSVPQTYIRAFIREYARQVGLDDDAVVAEYNELAEREAGIPRPPEAIDNSSILPHPDDSIEILSPAEVTPRHVEVIGSAEVADTDEAFVPPVRKSAYVKDEDASPIDIRTTPPPRGTAAATTPAGEPPPPQPDEAAPPMLRVPDIGEDDIRTRTPAAPAVPAATTPPQPSSAHTASAQTSSARGASAKDATAKSATAVVASTKDASTKDASAKSAPAKDASAKDASAKATSARAGSSAVAQASSAQSADTGDAHAAGDAARASLPARLAMLLATVRGKISRRSAAVTDAPPVQTRGASSLARKDAAAGTTSRPVPGVPPPPKMQDADSEQKRILVVGSIVVLIVLTTLYALYYFSSMPDEPSGTVDSTAIRASIDAGKFIDSSQNALTEPEAPQDTARPSSAAPNELEPRTKVYAKEDSLVLEAFSSAPVWFSVRMDTTRTERGSLGSNDHRVWKARDRFVITLGDAGAVVFFLNGREIGALGEEGAVIKNVTLNRQNAYGDQ